MSQEILLLGVRVIAFVVVALLVWLALWILRDLFAPNDGKRPKDRRAAPHRNASTPPCASSDRHTGAGKIRKKWKFIPAFLARRRTVPPSANARSDAPGADLPLTIMAPFGRSFGGKEIDDLVHTFGLRRSPDGVYELLNENGRDILFTMLDVDRPGTFPGEDDERHAIDGVLLVMRLPNGHDAVQSYETFSALASEMAEACDGRLCDFRRRPMQRKDLMKYHAAASQFQHEYDAWLLRHQDES